MLNYIQEQRKTMYRVSHNFDVQGVPKKNACKKFLPILRKEQSGKFRRSSIPTTVASTSTGNACRANLIVTSAGNACRA